MHTLQQLFSGELAGAKHLKLSCGLTEFPEEIFTLAGSLEVLDLSGNRLSKLPDDFARLSRLKICFFSDNLFRELPDVLSGCKELSMVGFKSNLIEFVPESSLPEKLRWFILTNNKIKKLPKAIGNCYLLQKAAFAGNCLTELPEEMARCKNLELLRISANKLTELPGWLLDLPRLSWLAFAGNPFSYVPVDSQQLGEVSWNEFEILEQLGEGASGNIYKALWHKKSGSVEVAVKVFKGEVTSDGFPDDEIRASVSAGMHPGLVKLSGKIKDHPAKRYGLIMDLIPSSFYNLGLPPSLDTCSRDTFKPGTVFTVGQILKIATAIASATGHLHERGISHGDLYAHNTLVDEDSNALIGDFGAASFYKAGSPRSEKIQQLESRAFGCFLDDLLMLLAPGEAEQGITKKLTQLKEDLMQENVSSRPVFEIVLKRLNEMWSY